jgi:hypothetical protein
MCLKRFIGIKILLMIALSAYGQNKVNLQTQVKGVLPISNGGTGTISPHLTAGTNVNITGNWPNQTINSISSGSLPVGCSSPSNGVLQCSLFSTTGNGTAGYVSLGQGSAPTTTPGTVQLVAPGSITAYNLVLPGSAGTGYLFSNVGSLSFQSATTANYYTNSGNTGLGPTLFTPNNTFNLVDTTASTGNTKTWFGYDGNGSFTGQHISAVRTNLSIVNGTGQSGAAQTDDAISFFNAAGGYRGGIITNGSNNAFTITSAPGVQLALGAAGGQHAFIQTSGVLTENPGVGVALVSTAAITGAVPVKADTTNANQVVVTTTADTGAGIPIGVCANSPGVGGTCHVILIGISSLKLGTGTCSIGNFVIVDTTTDGRVKCTGTYTAGTSIGVALAAQSTIGNTFNVLVGLR